MAGKPHGHIPIASLIWKDKNKTKEILKSRFSDRTPFYIQPGQRIVIPKQLEFLESIYKYDAVLYGGAMGGGKSYILMWSLVYICMKLALDGIDSPRVAMFSKTYQDTVNRHVNEIPSYFPSWMGKVYRSMPPEYHLAEEFGGGIIQFLNLSDPEHYKSVQFAAVAIDELTENKEAVFDYIMMRKRYKYVDFVPMLCASNPTGEGREWVKRRFVDEKTREQPRWNEKLKYQSKGFHYIEALPDDNPTLAKAYLDELSRKPEKLRRAYYEGDWDTFEGQYFNIDREVHQFHPFDIPPEWRRFRAIDAGYAHPTVCLWGAVDPSGNLWIYREYSETGGDNHNHDARYHKRRIAAMSVDPYTGEPEDYVMTVADPYLWKSDRSFSGNITWKEVFNDKNDGVGSFQLTKARSTEKRDGWFALLEGLGYDSHFEKGEDGHNHRIYTRRPRIRISTDCECLWNSLNSRQHDDKNPDVVAKSSGTYKPGEGDDETDTLRYLYLAAIKGSFGTTKDERLRNTPQRRDRTRDDNGYAGGMSTWAT